MQTQKTATTTTNRLSRFWKDYCRIVNQTMYFK